MVIVSLIKCPTDSLLMIIMLWVDSETGNSDSVVLQDTVWGKPSI